jgi:NADPH-dependent curcumin reductase CurA
VMGMPGLTAYVGLLDIGQPQSGETVVVSSAAGAVGSVVGQIARLHGCNTVGIAGTAEKCRYTVEEFGFETCLNYNDEDFDSQLKDACPEGVDIYFENVGGKVFDAAYNLMNDGGRIPVCGMISRYNDTSLPDGPDTLPRLMRAVLTRRLLVRGYIVTDHGDRLAAFMSDMSNWLKRGEIRYREDITDGLENAVTAFQGLLSGRNTGKAVVRVSPDL